MPTKYSFKEVTIIIGTTCKFLLMDLKKKKKKTLIRPRVRHSQRLNNTMNIILHNTHATVLNYVFTSSALCGVLEVRKHVLDIFVSQDQRTVPCTCAKRKNE